MVLHTVRLRRLKPSICARPKRSENGSTITSHQDLEPGHPWASPNPGGKMQVDRQILKPSFACQMVVVLLISGNHQICATKSPFCKCADASRKKKHYSFRRTTKTAKGSSGFCGTAWCIGNIGSSAPCRCFEDGNGVFFLMKPSWILYNQVYESNICNHIFLAKMQLSIFHVNYSLQVMLPPTKKSILMLQQTNQLKKSPQLPWTSVLMHFGWAASTVYTKKCEVSLKSKILVRSQGE